MLEQSTVGKQWAEYRGIDDRVVVGLRGAGFMLLSMIGLNQIPVEWNCDAAHEAAVADEEKRPGSA